MEIAVEASQTPAQLPDVRIAVAGRGQDGRHSAAGVFEREPVCRGEDSRDLEPRPRTRWRSAPQWGVDVGTDNVEAVRQADLILIAVKPFQVPDLIAEIKPALTKDKTVVSIAASVRRKAIEEASGLDIGVIRAMPNTPSALGAGIAALCRGRFVSAESTWNWRKP